ncbi:MAG TPA: type II toxin-antitoxin system RelE/ParE family toxin [Acidobacteriaceae bacterium]
MDSQTYELLRCHTDDDRIPIQEWTDSLDAGSRARVRIQIDKMEDGNFGDIWPIGDGASETRLDFGPGYRIYFALQGKVVHLLGGGTKKRQQVDIDAAKKLWKSHAKN